MVGYNSYPTRYVFSIISPRFGDRKHNSLDKDHNKPQTMGNPIYMYMKAIMRWFVFSLSDFFSCVIFFIKLKFADKLSGKSKRVAYCYLTQVWVQYSYSDSMPIVGSGVIIVTTH